MANMLKSVREIAEDLRDQKDKTKDIFIHGVGVITDVRCKKIGESIHWTFDMKLDNGILIESGCRIRNGYLEKGDRIEFFGTIATSWVRRRMESVAINILQLKLSDETKCFTDVLMWDIEIEALHYVFGPYRYNRASTDKHHRLDCCVIAITEMDEDFQIPENEAWAYGHLVRSSAGIMLQLDKILE